MSDPFDSSDHAERSDRSNWPKPRFAFNEVVRVAHPKPGKEEALGLCSPVIGLGDEALPYVYGLFLEPWQRVWCFDEDELETTGVFAAGAQSGGTI